MTTAAAITIMPFEGITYPSYEDEYGIGITTDADENPLSAEDEAYYISILDGTADDEDRDYGDQMERDFDPDFDPDGWKGAQNAYDRWVYGE
jgi:hypothetical protein